jgi:hypothetical protein
MCSPQVNADCAYRFYSINRITWGWNIWENSAKACGCDKVKEVDSD